MKHNIGSYDSAARVLIGFMIVAVAYHARSWWGALALVPFLTGALGYCPVYQLFGWDTTAQDEHEHHHPPPPSSNVTKA